MNLFTENLIPAVTKSWCKHVNLSQAYFQMTIFAVEQNAGICFVPRIYMYLFTPRILYQRILSAKSTVKIKSAIKTL